MMVFFLARCALSAFLIGLFQGLVPGQRQGLGVFQPPLQRQGQDVLQSPPELLDDEPFFSDDGDGGQDGAWGDDGQGGAKAKTASVKTAKTAKAAKTAKTASVNVRDPDDAAIPPAAAVAGIFLFFPDLI